MMLEKLGYLVFFTRVFGEFGTQTSTRQTTHGSVEKITTRFDCQHNSLLGVSALWLIELCCAYFPSTDSLKEFGVGVF